jgi:hypothetical protein
MIDAALAYAARGWHVFPCRPRGKTPLTAHGVKDATDDLEQVSAWWTATPDANIGIATGQKSGLVVIDLDGEHAEDAYGLLVAEHGPPGGGWQHRRRRGTLTRVHLDGVGPTDGATVRTGSGWHLYLAVTTDRLTVRNSASKLAPGIDIRGDGGYVIAPPSVHPSGRRYVWRDPVPPDGGLPVLAPAWVRLLMPNPAVATKRRQAAADAAGGGTPYGLAALNGECDAVRTTGEGGRNHRLNEAAFAAGTLIASGDLEQDHAIDQLTAAAEDAGLPQREADKTIASGLKAGRRHPRDRAT